MISRRPPLQNLISVTFNFNSSRKGQKCLNFPLGDFQGFLIRSLAMSLSLQMFKTEFKVRF